MGDLSMKWGACALKRVLVVVEGSAKMAGAAGAASFSTAHSTKIVTVHHL